MVKLSSCDRNLMALKALTYFLSGPLQRLRFLSYLRVPAFRRGFSFNFAPSEGLILVFVTHVVAKDQASWLFQLLAYRSGFQLPYFCIFYFFAIRNALFWKQQSLCSLQLKKVAFELCSLLEVRHCLVLHLQLLAWYLACSSHWSPPQRTTAEWEFRYLMLPAVPVPVFPTLTAYVGLWFSTRLWPMAWSLGLCEACAFPPQSWGAGLAPPCPGGQVLSWCAREWGLQGGEQEGRFPSQEAHSELDMLSVQAHNPTWRKMWTNKCPDSGHLHFFPFGQVNGKTDTWECFHPLSRHAKIHFSN